MKIHICLSLFIILLFSCTSRENNAGRAGYKFLKWYALENGKFHEAGGPSAKKREELLPWTIQERVSDIAYDSGKIIIGINGYGVALVDQDKASAPHFHYFFDRSLFSERTLTMFLPFGDQVCCHFYLNSSLGSGANRYDKKKTCNFAFFPVQGVLDRFIPYFLPSEQDREGYEAVGFLPASKINWYIEWKKAGEITRFKYCLYEMAGSRETVISRERYRDAYSFTDVNARGVSPEIKLLSDEILRKNPLSRESTTYHFLMKEKDTNLVERYESKAKIDSTDDSFEIRNVIMFSDEKGLWALDGSEALFSLKHNSKAIIETSLPQMPPGFEYTTLFVSDQYVLLAWEESLFYKTGNAGILVAAISNN